ncbi:MAG: alpha-E domain-containing protein [Lachnospiraceae bacterium]|nr:alpha-E domain-containing protein [Lachnospiraceae bacterium]
MGIISLEQKDRLLWLGRYSERVYTTIRLFFMAYDSFIDDLNITYEELCRQLDIPDVYGSKKEFCKKYAFDEKDVNSIFSNLNRAYDNAIVLREELGTETLSYIQLAIYDMNKAKISKAPLIELQKVKDNILAFWGIADDVISSDKVRNIIKTGKRIERVDMYARLKRPREDLKREVDRLAPRIANSGLDYDKDKIENIKKLVDETKIDYYKIVNEVESIL